VIVHINGRTRGLMLSSSLLCCRSI
jgi:hypothetical protein